MRLFKSLAAQIAIRFVNVLANERALEREREKALLLSISEEMATIRSAHAGKVIVSPELMQKLAGRIGGYGLTGRETEILDLMVDGKTNQQIADALLIAESTVKFHINNIFAKLGVADRTQAVVVALKSGLARL